MAASRARTSAPGGRDKSSINHDRSTFTRKKLYLDEQLLSGVIHNNSDFGLYQSDDVLNLP
jgi:hypothetical protein